MQWISDRIQKDPQFVAEGPVSMGQIVQQLKEVFGAQEAPLSLFSAHTVQMQRENACCYAQDEQIELLPEAVKLRAVWVPVTNRTRKYVQKDFTPWTVADPEYREGIFAVYEETSNYFYCNSSMLHLELAIARGIPAADIRGKTEKYREYEGLIRRYLETYTDLKG